MVLPAIFVRNNDPEKSGAREHRALIGRQVIIGADRPAAAIEDN